MISFVPLSACGNEWACSTFTPRVIFETRERTRKSRTVRLTLYEERRIRGTVACSVLAVFAFLPASAQVQDPASAQVQISAGATSQIRAFMAEKASRTPAQRKISSHLLYGMKVSAGKGIAPGVKTPRSAVIPDASGKVLVDIRGKVTKALIKAIENVGGRVIYSSVPTGSIRASVPAKKLEALAARKDVRYIGPAIGAFTQRYQAEGAAKVQFTPNALASVSPKLRAGLKPGFDQRAQNIASQLGPLLARAGKGGITPSATGDNPSPVDTAGDIAHRANEARDFFGINGAGVKVGVLSDSVDFLDQVQAAGNLPEVTVLPGQSGLGEENSGEGTAMLEIVHALAPGASSSSQQLSPATQASRTIFVLSARGLRRHRR